MATNVERNVGEQAMNNKMEHLINPGRKIMKNINPKSILSKKLLHEASLEGATETVKILIKWGVEVGHKNWLTGHTPLHLAAVRGHLDVVKLLVEAGAPLNKRSKDKQTPLHLAAWLGKGDVVDFLLSKGARLETIDKLGHSPLWSACNEKHFAIAKVLIRRGANVNISNRFGKLVDMNKANDPKYIDIINIINCSV